MLDTAMRQRICPVLDRLGVHLSRWGVGPTMVTAGGFLIGVAACVAVADQRWTLGLVLWLANRVADGLDGAIARHRGPTDLGGYLDIMADFTVYGGMAVALGIALPEARVAVLFVLLAYYVSGSAFLAWSSLAAKKGRAGNGRSLHFPAGLAEGTETIVAYCVILLWPQHAVRVLWVWAAIVGITVVQRLWFVTRELRS